MSTVTIFEQTCKGVEDCGICTFVSPKSLFRVSAGMNQTGFLHPKIDQQEECTGCKNCMIYCPDFAIVVEKEDSTHTVDREEEDE
jgi:2-oxoglutarate ferredoxin oxidoreductase subunit delta